MNYCQPSGTGAGTHRLLVARMSRLDPNWVRLATNWTNLGILRSDFSTESPRFVPFEANINQFGANLDIPSLLSTAGVPQLPHYQICEIPAK